MLIDQINQSLDKNSHYFVKMMKATKNSILINSIDCNSSETVKIKKSNSSSNSMKGISNYMISSLNGSETENKHLRTQNASNSNKKNVLLNSHSNKSMRAFKEITSSLNIVSNKNTILHKKINQNEHNHKITIPVKNIKQKILGKHGNQSSINPVNKIQTICHPTNLIHQTQGIQHQPNLHKEFKKYLHTDHQKSNITPRNRRDQNSSLLNFSTFLKPKSEEHKVSIEEFQIGRKLGKGRFGDVYMARNIKTRFVLAIKMIHKKELKESQMENQLIQEIKIQTFTNHPNILKMYGFFDDHSKIYLMLELATHGCLFKEIRKKNYFEENQASFYFRQIASGVRFLHSNYVIHRDLKPENILNCFNVLKICDFGWAIYSPIYKRQTFCGTLDYVPPQIVTGEYYDEKVDLWCLGVLCYELVTGKAPFESKTDQNQTYDKILKVTIEFPIYLSPTIVDFIGKILHREPTKRMSLDQLESHQWIRKYENQAGRMISKDIWDCWINISKNQPQ